METLFYIFGVISFWTLLFVVFSNSLYKIAKGFEPTSIIVKDKNGKKYFVPKRIYKAINLNNPFGKEGQSAKYYERIANHNPSKLIEVTDKHNMDWMWYFNTARDC